MNIYISKNGTQIGPFSKEQVKSMLAGGLVASIDLACCKGSSEWTPLQTLLELGDLPPVLREHTPVAASHLKVAQPESPKGVGGWLAFFCVNLTILQPAVVFVWMVVSWAQAKPSFVIFPIIEKVMVLENLGSIILTVYGFIVGCIIWSGNSNGRFIARNYLLISLIVFIGIEIIALRMMSDLPSAAKASALAEVVGGIFRAVFNFLIWWFYFIFSKRVQNTYGSR